MNPQPWVRLRVDPSAPPLVAVQGPWVAAVVQPSLVHVLEARKLRLVLRWSCEVLSMVWSGTYDENQGHSNLLVLLKDGRVWQKLLVSGKAAPSRTLDSVPKERWGNFKSFPMKEQVSSKSSVQGGLCITQIHKLTKPATRGPDAVALGEDVCRMIGKAASGHAFLEPVQHTACRVNGTKSGGLIAIVVSSFALHSYICAARTDGCSAWSMVEAAVKPHGDTDISLHRGCDGVFVTPICAMALQLTQPPTKLVSALLSFTPKWCGLYNLRRELHQPDPSSPRDVWQDSDALGGQVGDVVLLEGSLCGRVFLSLLHTPAADTCEYTLLREQILDIYEPVAAIKHLSVPKGPTHIIVIAGRQGSLRVGEMVQYQATPYPQMRWRVGTLHSSIGSVDVCGTQLIYTTKGRAYSVALVENAEGLARVCDHFVPVPISQKCSDIVVIRHTELSDAWQAVLLTAKGDVSSTKLRDREVEDHKAHSPSIHSRARSVLITSSSSKTAERTSRSVMRQTAATLDALSVESRKLDTTLQTVNADVCNAHSLASRDAGLTAFRGVSVRVQPILHIRGGKALRRGGLRIQVKPECVDAGLRPHHSIVVSLKRKGKNARSRSLCANINENIPFGSVFIHEWRDVEALGVPWSVVVYLAMSFLPDAVIPRRCATSALFCVYNGVVDVHDWIAHIGAHDPNDISARPLTPPYQWQVLPGSRLTEPVSLQVEIGEAQRQSAQSTQDGRVAVEEFITKSEQLFGERLLSSHQGRASKKGRFGSQNSVIVHGSNLGNVALIHEALISKAITRGLRVQHPLEQSNDAGSLPENLLALHRRALTLERRIADFIGALHVAEMTTEHSARLPTMGSEGMHLVLELVQLFLEVR